MAAFHLFPRLPTELRQKIYTLSLPTPRLVPLTYHSPTSYSNSRNTSPSPLRGCTSPAPIPSLLHLSNEARALALQHYELGFPLAGPPGSFLSKVWFDFRLDTLYLPELLPSVSGGGAVEREGDDSGETELAKSWKNFLYVMMVGERRSMGRVRRLAVHEGLFVDYLAQGKGVEDSHWGRERSAACRASEFSRLKDFWGYVKTRFGSVEEVIFICRNVTDRLRSSRTRSWSNEFLGFEKNGVWDMGKHAAGMCHQLLDESFTDIVGRAAGVVQAECEDGGEDDEWLAPRWRVECEDDL